MKNPVIALNPAMPDAMAYLGIIEDRHNKRAALLASQSEDGYVRLFVLDRSALNHLLKPEAHGVSPEAFTDFKISSPFINSAAYANSEANASAVTRARRGGYAKFPSQAKFYPLGQPDYSSCQ